MKPDSHLKDAMTKIFFQSCNTDQPFANHHKSVVGQVDLSRCRELTQMKRSTIDLLDQCHPSGRAGIWGFPDKETGERDFAQLNTGDLFLFHRDAEVFWGSTVTAKWLSQELARELWPPDERSQVSYPHVFALGDHRETSSPLPELMELLGRNPRGRPATGTWPVDADAVLAATIRVRLSGQPRGDAAKPTEISMFLSYAHRNSQIVHELAEQLRHHGVRVWIDKEDILIGDRFIRNISEAISSHKFFVPVVSASYLKSNWCMKELGQAATLEADGRVRAILPVRVGNVRLPPMILDISYHDLDESDIARTAELLVRSAQLHVTRNVS